jgi:hypothetical protein
MGELEQKVNEAVRVALNMTLITGCCAVMMYVGYKNLVSTGAIPPLSSVLQQSEPKKEHEMGFESDEVMQLAFSAVRKKGRTEKYAEFKKIDSDSNGTITEQEVLNYVRNH